MFHKNTKISFIVTGVLVIIISLFSLGADRYGCTAKKLCADAHATCSGSTPENCGIVSFPDLVVTCGKGTAEHCDHSGDLIKCGKWTSCYWEKNENKCIPDLPYSDLTINACRAW